MVRDRRDIRDRVDTLPPRERTAMRAVESGLAVRDRIVPGTRIRRGDLTIEFDQPPAQVWKKQAPIRVPDGTFTIDPDDGQPYPNYRTEYPDPMLVGIDAMVRVFRGREELQVDPHRICINPPLLVADPSDPEGYREDPYEAFLMWLEGTIRHTPSPKGWRTRGTVTSIYPSTNLDDGYQSSTSATYSTARTGGTLFATANPSGQGNYVGQYFDGADYICYEAVFGFLTSGLADETVVDSVSLMLQLGQDFSTTDFTVQARLCAAVDPADTATWLSGASLTGETLAAEKTTSTLAAGFNTFTNSGTVLLDAVQAQKVSGSVFLRLSSSRHRDGNTPTGFEYVSFTDSMASGTASDPKLEVEHESVFVLVQQVITDTPADSSSPFVSVLTISATQAGNLLVLVIAQAAASTSVDISSITDNIGTGTWVFHADQNGATGAGPPPHAIRSGSNTCVSIAYMENCPAGITSITITWAAASKINSVNTTEWSGAALSSVVDVTQASDHAAADPITPTTVATTNARDLIVAGICTPTTVNAVNHAGTSPANIWIPMTFGAMGSTRLGCAFLTRKATATVGPSWDLSSSAASGCVTLAFKAAPLASGPPSLARPYGSRGGRELAQLLVR